MPRKPAACAKCNKTVWINAGVPLCGVCKRKVAAIGRKVERVREACTIDREIVEEARKHLE